jgi:hypothetical protein
MDHRILNTHPGAEAAVTSYFDSAHALSVLGRLRQSAAEMEAMIEVVTGRPPDEDTARSFVFPD